MTALESCEGGNGENAKGADENQQEAPITGFWLSSKTTHRTRGAVECMAVEWTVMEEYLLPTVAAFGA